MTDEQRRARDNRGMVVSALIYAASLAGDFLSNVAANQVGSLRLQTLSLVLGGLALAGLVVFASRRFTTELGRARAAAGPIRPETAFPPVPPLAGRDETVREITACARRHGVVVVHGPAGIGASAAAVAAGLELAPGPGKQRYIDLRGQSPRDPESVNRTMIRVLGVFGVRPRYAQSPQRAIAELAENLQGTGIVLILDNAQRAEQVAWLARGVRGARVIVAGDFPVRDLPDGVPQVRVPPLTADTALVLLARQGEPPGAGAGQSRRLRRLLQLPGRRAAAANPVAARIAAEPAAAAELAARYLSLPRVAIEMGRWLAANPQLSLADVLQDLRAGERSSELGYIIRRQLDGTSAAARRLLGLLAQAPVAELTPAAVAAMADAGQERTAELLAELSSRSLVEWRRPSRCRITPEARQLAEPPPAKAAAAALTRLARHFAVLAAAHAEALAPGQSQEAAGQAAGWFRGEDVTLLHLVTAPGPPPRAAQHLWQVAAALDTWFAREHRPEDRQAAAAAMAEAAASLGDGTAVAVAQLRLAALARERGDLAAAAEGLERVHRLLPAADPWRIQLHTEYTVHFLTIGDLHAARDHLLAARQARPRRDTAGRITDLINQAALEIRCGELDAARASLVQALDLAEDSADTAGQAHAHELLGLVAYRGGHPHLASRAWAQAGTLYEQAGDDLGQARCLQHEGSARLAQPGGDRSGAVAMLSRSLILRADQPPGIGAGLAHLYLAEQAARAAETEEVAWHCRAGLTALRAWAQEAAEPSEVTSARARLADLQRGVLSR